MSTHKRRRAAPRRASWLNDSVVGTLSSGAHFSSFERRHEQQQQQQEENHSLHLHELNLRASRGERGEQTKRPGNFHAVNTVYSKSGYYSSVVSPSSRPRAIGSPSAASGTLSAIASSLRPGGGPGAEEAKVLGHSGRMYRGLSRAPTSSPSSASLYSTTYTATPTTGPKRSPGTGTYADEACP